MVIIPTEQEYWNEFLDIFQYNNLYAATKASTRGNKWKGTTIAFLNNLSDNLIHLYLEIQNRNYHVQPYYEFDILERGKKRHIQSVRIRDRVVQHALCDQFLIPKIYKSFIYDNCASQTGKGISFGIERMSILLDRACKEYGRDNIYILQLDIRKFFESIDHEYIKGVIRRFIKNPFVLEMVDEVIDSFDKGLGLGSQLCQVLALLSLNDMDHYSKEVLHIKYYIRYMDDAILILNDKERLKEIKYILEKYLKECKFTLNLRKTQIYHIDQSIHFIGFRFQIKGNKIHSELLSVSIKREKRKLRKQQRLIENGKMTIQDIYISYRSWRAFACLGTDRHKINMMDLYFESIYGFRPMKKELLRYLNKIPVEVIKEDEIYIDWESLDIHEEMNS